MKTLRDTNNNNSNNATSNETIYHNSNQQSIRFHRDIFFFFSFNNNNLDPLISTYNNNDTINPLVYLQLMNANTMFMQQLSSIQNSNDLNNQILTNDSNIFLPKTRPMTQNEIAEHARLIYQRALQRNQLQQHNELMKHFYDMKSISNRTQVPTVPNVTNIGTFDGVDTMITSPSSCVSIKDGSINDIRSSLSLISLDENKMNNSILDPSAPVFIPRQNQQKFDDENETVKRIDEVILTYIPFSSFSSRHHHRIQILMIFIILINFLKNFIIQIMNMIII